MRPPSFGVRRSAFGVRHFSFTLIELLVVIAVIIVLFALMLPAVNMVRGFARRGVAKTEATHIAAAWEHYYSQYQRWPSTLVTSGDPIPLEGDVALVLCPPRGSAIVPGDPNPRRLAFVTYNRINTNGVDRFYPVNPWGNEGASPLETWKYYAMFDTDFDNSISVDDCGDDPWLKPITNDVHASVIVWTVNTDVAPGELRYIIGSWNE